ncbi:MAG: glutathione S-transferase family protein [Kofleriaceae bacterium]
MRATDLETSRRVYASAPVPHADCDGDHLPQLAALRLPETRVCAHAARHGWERVRCYRRAVITLYGFGTIFREGIGETRDLRAQWVLEETGIPYRVHALDHDAGEQDGEAYGRISPFRQVPVIDDDGFVVSESAAIVLYVAEKAGTLIPRDMQGRMRVTQWCFAAVATVEPTFTCLDVVGIFDPQNRDLASQVRVLAKRWLEHVERRLDGREWIACDEFTAADIIMAGVLHRVRKDHLLESFPQTEAYFARCLARPAWKRTQELYAKRLGVTTESIR